MWGVGILQSLSLGFRDSTLITEDQIENQESGYNPSYA